MWEWRNLSSSLWKETACGTSPGAASNSPTLHTGILRDKEQTFLEIIRQRGEYLCLGDFTASRRLCDLDNKRARHNLLSLEIFDIDGGRILIESSSMELTIGEHRWQMEPTDEYAQIMSNQDMYRSHVQQFINSYTGILDDENDPLPSIPWDGRLRRAEAAAVIYPPSTTNTGRKPTASSANPMS